MERKWRDVECGEVCRQGWQASMDVAHTIHEGGECTLRIACNVRLIFWASSALAVCSVTACKARSLASKVFSSFARATCGVVPVRAEGCGGEVRG